MYSQVAKEVPIRKVFFPKTDCILHLDTLYSSMDEAEAMDVQPSCKKCSHQKSFFPKTDCILHLEAGGDFAQEEKGEQAKPFFVFCFL